MKYVACSLCEPPCYGDCRMGDAGYEQAVALAQAAARIAALTEALREAQDGLRYWHPQTHRGDTEKARIVALVTAALTPEDR